MERIVYMNVYNRIVQGVFMYKRYYEAVYLFYTIDDNVSIKNLNIKTNLHLDRSVHFLSHVEVQD